MNPSQGPNIRGQVRTSAPWSSWLSGPPHHLQPLKPKGSSLRTGHSGVALSLSTDPHHTAARILQHALRPGSHVPCSLKPLGYGLPDLDSHLIPCSTFRGRTVCSSLLGGGPGRGFPYSPSPTVPAYRQGASPRAPSYRLCSFVAFIITE